MPTTGRTRRPPRTHAGRTHLADATFMALNLLLLAAGLVVLIYGAHLLVKGAATFAAKAGISPLIIGLTLVSFGTSLPELLVTMVSGLRDNADLAIANILGSNIANVLLVLGVAAAIRPLPVRDSTVVSEIPFSLSAAILVGFLANAALFSPVHKLTISRLDGLILLFFFALFMLYVYKASAAEHAEDGSSFGEVTRGRSALYMILGVVGLYFGGEWVVDGAMKVAADLRVNDAVIGLTVIAIGTSAPELVASAVAAFRGQTDIAVGNVIGSNIFNILWVLGFTATVVELPFEVVSNTDLLMVIVASSLVILALVTGRRNTINRAHGVLFVLLYFVYIAFVVQRG